jgi:hypothetical protein
MGTVVGTGEGGGGEWLKGMGTYTVTDTGTNGTRTQLHTAGGITTLALHICVGGWFVRARVHGRGDSDRVQA